MNTDKIFDESGKGFTRVFSEDKIEKVNPIELFKKQELEKRAIMIQDVLFATNPWFASFLDKNYVLKKAEETLIGFFEKFEQVNLNENFEKLLISEKKDAQIKLLRGLTITPEELTALIFKSHTHYGYLYSKYVFENLPNGLDGKRLPKLFRLKEDGSIDKVGDTDLTDGQLKNVIHHRSVVVSHFLEIDDVWHCFFITYASIAGKESWKDGQPHYHYISSAFGITREDFIESMRNGKYRSTPVHIDLLEYGQQPQKL